MKIIYTAQPIGGVIKELNINNPVQKRIAKETLISIIEEELIRHNLAVSYTIADNMEFPFPLKIPDIIKLGEANFFGNNPDYNLVAKEIKELYEQPGRLLSLSEKKLMVELENATDKQLLEILGRYHFSYNQRLKEKYFKAIDDVKESWQPYEQVGKAIEYLGYNGFRSHLVDSLNILNDPSNLTFLKDLNEVEQLLNSGERSKAIDKILFFYDCWKKKNLAPLYHACGDEISYGAGFFIARMVVSNYFINDSDLEPMTIRNTLNSLRKPYQVIDL